MDLSALKRWRVVVPSVCLGLVFAPLLYAAVEKLPQNFFPGDLLGDAIKCGLVLLFLPLGYLYDAFQLRRIMNRASLERINLYVEGQLRITLQPLVSSAQLASAPSGDKRWLRLLYKQVDSDPTLSEIAKIIRDNGLRWTTAADIATIFIPGGILSGLAASLLGFSAVTTWALMLSLVGFLSGALIPTLERRHLQLCGDQQDHIRLFLSAQLATDFAKIFP